MNLRSAVPLTFLLLLSCDCIAGGTYLGAGGATCAYWAQQRQQDPKIALMVDLWLLGYVSGLNFAMYVEHQIDLLEHESRENVIRFVEGYCASNQNGTMNNAANAYWDHLVRASRR